MDYLRRLEPTPSALRNGRLTMVIASGAVAVLVVLMLMDERLRDAGTIGIAASTALTVVGHGIAYLGQPDLSRYRIGLAIMAIGIVGAFAFLFLFPAPAI